MINALNNRTPATGGSGQTPAAGGEASAQRRQELRQAAQAFEAVFIRQLIGSMRNARLADDMFGSQATEQFRDMADARLADSMSQQGTFGIAELLTAQFERHRSVQPPQPAADGARAETDANGARNNDEQNDDEVTR